MAIKERDVVFVSTNEDNDTIIDMPVTRENCVEGLGRIRGTAYSVGDVALCAGSQSLQLICTKSGTTSLNELDITGKSAGDSITDGTVEWVCSSRMQAGVPIGFEYFSTNPNIPAGSIPLFGGEYSRTTYSDLWNWVQTQAGYLLTESEWQAKSSANDGNVPFYSNGDGTTTFRVPSLKCWVKGANGIEEVGSYLSAGLPNITGGLRMGGASSGQWVETDGAITATLNNGTGLGNGGHICRDLYSTFDASKSNPIYGNSDTVQPKSIVGMWLVKAYGTVTNVGSTDVASIAQGLTELETRQGDYVNKTLASDKALAVSWCMPDYSSSIAKAFNTLHTAECNGYLYVFAFTNLNINILLNGVGLSNEKGSWFGGNDGDKYMSSSALIPLKKGDTYLVNGNYYNHITIKFIPCIGG